MAMYKKCPFCGANLDLGEKCDCKKEKASQMTPFEKTRATVYVIGNKWAIENFNATHY